MSRHREHPAALPRNLSTFFFLLLLPLIRGVGYIRVPNGFPTWLESLWIDGVILASALAVLTALWWQHTYDLTPHRLRIRQRFIIHTTTLIPLPLITTLTVESPLWLRLLGGARVAADTDAGNHRLADVRLTVSRRQARLFLPDDRGDIVRVPQGRLWLLAVLSSDSLGGILLLAAVFRQSGNLLGESIQKTVMDNLEYAAEAIQWIPRTAALVALVLLGGWITGTLRHLLRHLPFSACRCEDRLTIRTGLLTKRTHCCALGAINYADRRQTLMAHLLRLYTVTISCTGYGKDKNTLAVLVPPARLKQLQREQSVLLPEFEDGEVTLRTAPHTLWRYIRTPLIWLGVFPVIGWAVGRQFPMVRELAVYLSLVAAAPCLWMLAVRIVDHRTAGMGYDRGRYTLCYSRRLTLHRVTLPKDKVAAAHIRQSRRQQKEGTCDVCLYSYHEFRHPHPVHGLRLDEVTKLTQLLNLKEVETMENIRTDQLVAQQLNVDVNTAAALIMEGRIWIGNVPADKPGTPLPADTVITCREKAKKYASRSGYKLEKALAHFDIDPADLIVCDIGASNGGFTDCLLQNSAQRVFAVDVAYGILDYKLRIDKRVTVLERTNARHLTAEQLDGTICDMVTVDVSFISLKRIYPAIHRVLKEGGEAVTLIKPQFEAKQKELGKNGILKDPAATLPLLMADLFACAAENELTVLGLTVSPIHGTNGNVEYLAHYRHTAPTEEEMNRYDEMIQSVLELQPDM